MATAQFMELNRYFRDITESSDAEEAALRSYLLGFNNSKEKIVWDELLKSRVVVVLGEPGSGKTWELRNRAKLIKQGGGFAFFIPLDRLIDSPLLNSILPSEEQSFRRFHDGAGQATFFLDSVDEAKLRNPKDFARALDEFVRGLGHSPLKRARIVISSRISEWRWHADGDELALRFGPFEIPKEKSAESPSISELCIVQIEPLDRKQVHVLAEGIGLNDPDAFLQALDDHYAWEFARRPIDAASLIAYWREHRLLGTLSAFTEFDLANKLKESMDRNDPISSAQARTGAECLAAAVMLCNRASFWVPDLVLPEDDGALMAAECLPTDWTAEMHKAVLSRAIFDSASYGRIRFHHRRIAEYLAAKWLQKRMEEGCPYRELEDILFLQSDGGWITRSRMRPIAAWLAIGDEPWNRRIRQKILVSAPDVFLTHGDPESLPTEYKEALLNELIARYKGRRRIFLEDDDQILSRLADPALAKFISEKLRDEESPLEIRVLLTKIIRHGRLQECINAILEIVVPSEENELALYAVAVVRDIGDRSARERLAQIVEHEKTMPTRYCSLLCETLYPDVIGPRELADLLRKVKNIQFHSVDLPFYLKRHLEVTLPDDHASELLKGLLDLFQSGADSVKEEDQLAPQYYWLGNIIPCVLNRLLSCARLDGQEAELAARALWLLECFKRHVVEQLEFPDEFQNNLSKHSEVRRVHFELRVLAEMKENPSAEPIGFLFYYWGQIVTLGEADIIWLIYDIGEAISSFQRNVALRFAVALGAARKLPYRRQIRNAITGEPELLKLFNELTSYHFIRLMKSIWYRHWVYEGGMKFRRWRHLIQRRYSGILNKIWCFRHLGSLHDGSAVRALSILASEASGSRNRWGAESWQSLTTKWGRVIARAAGEGWKAAWRKNRPYLPHEAVGLNQNDLISVGLSGINVEIAEGLEIGSLTPSEAEIACRYAINEMNGVPAWFSGIVRAHPAVVSRTLAECIHSEWNIPSDKKNYFGGVFGTLCHTGQIAIPLVQDVILEKLKSADPQHHLVLEEALTILLKNSRPPLGALSTIARQRTHLRKLGDPALSLWLAVWMQVDAGPAIKYLREVLACESGFREFLETFCAGLSSFRHRGYPLIKNPDFESPVYLPEFIRLVFDYIRPEDDIDRSNQGPFSPTPRDDAQHYRSTLLEYLSQIPGREAEEALHSFADSPSFSQYRDVILHLLEKRSRNINDTPSWSPTDIPRFMLEHETTPRSDYQLFKIALKRLRDIKDEVEHGEISSRYDLHPEDKEARLRSWLARRLRDRSRNRFTVPQETEIDLGQKPDLRIEAPSIEPVSVEVKWADNWSVKDLVAGLVDQLVGRYLRAESSNYGIYVIGYKGQKKYWEEWESNCRLSFVDLVRHLGSIANSMVQARCDISGLEVFGIDFSTPAGTKR